jgi:hypothetical protein
MQSPQIDAYSEVLVLFVGHDGNNLIVLAEGGDQVGQVGMAPGDRVTSTQLQYEPSHLRVFRMSSSFRMRMGLLVT